MTIYIKLPITNLNVDWNLLASLLESLNCMHPTNDRSFVIGGPSAIQFTILLRQLERFCIPSVSLKRYDVLHIGLV